MVQIPLLSWTGAALAILIATLLGAVNVYLFMEGQEGLSLRIWLPIYWTAWAIGLVMPGQVGDVATISVMLKRRGIRWQLALGRSLLDKAISITTVIAVATAWLLLRNIASTRVMLSERLFHVLVAAGGAVLFAITAGLMSRAVRRAVATPFMHSRDVLKEVCQTAKNKPGTVCINFVVTAIKLATTGFAYWAVIRTGFSGNLSLIDTVGAATAAGIVAYLPISINGVGSVEAVGIALFGTIGVPPETVLAGYISLRLIVFALAWSPLLAYMAYVRN
jgi:uncharacterized membrane protein YbhN (UPF0104 family)